MDFPFPVPDARFDQKQEMFKRAMWDETVQAQSQRFYREVRYKDIPGYGKRDYALRNASWNVEWSAALGNSRSNYGLYAWDGVPDKIRHFLEAGEHVKGSLREMSRIIKKAARFFRADLVGITRVHPNWIYSHEFNLVTGEHTLLEIPENCRYAVVMAIAMDYESMRSAPTSIGGASTGLGYSGMAFSANLLACFIRGLGYQAIPCGNDTALSIPLAMAAGLGECGRLGLLITEKYGPRVRLCKVFTDLPLEVDHYRPFGVVEFCRTCGKCAAHCPSKAINGGEMTREGPSISNQSGPLKWYVDPERCFSFWAANRMDCSTCIRVCPYNKPFGILHDSVRAVSRRTTLFNRFFVWMDDWMGYGKRAPAQAFWNEP